MASSGNFSTMNPLHRTSTNVQYSNGNLTFSPSSSWSETTFTRNNMVIPKDKKIYFEVYYKTQSGYYAMHGLSAVNAIPTSSQSGSTGTILIYNDSTRINGTRTDGVVTAASQGDVIGIAIDGSNNKVWFAVNNTWQISGDPANGTNEIGTITTNDTVGHDITAAFNQNSVSSLTVNFGQDSTFGGDVTAGGNADGNGFGDFAYAPPTGFLALCTGNLSVSDDIDPAQTDDDYPSKQFNTILYTGNDGAQSVSNLGFKPDLVWIKARNSAQHHAMFDSSRGALKRIGSSRTNAEDTDSSFLSSFDTDGFSWSSGGDNTQNGSYNYVAWCWRANGGTTASNSNGQTTSTVQANQAAGFSIVEYAGSLTSSGTKTIGHGLSKAPEFIIKKQVNKSGRWYVWHTGMSGASYMLELNSNAAEVDKSGNGSMSLPTSTVFSTNYTEGSNENNYNNVTYCWHGVDGYSKFGKYTGNGNTNGIFVYTGFRPKLVYLKKSSGSGAWNIFYSPPKTFNSSANDYIVWSNSDSEANGVPVDFLSNGFKIRSSGAGVNGNGDNYVYGAWGDVPFKYNNTF
jgi:hypothetical protein